MTPTWYDLLGIEPHASSEEIRAAWKAAITHLDPGDRQFRTLNEAAEVLLDADRRAAYDETLAPERAASERRKAKESRAASETAEPARPGRAVPAWLLAALAVLTALALAAAGYLLAQPSDDEIAKATTEAQSAAEHATPLVLTYDFRHLDQDQKAVRPLLTSGYRKEYDKLLAAIKENADRVKPIVSADVTASGIVRASADRVVVLVLVERHVANAQGSEPLYQDQVRVTMERDGDDWLVDKMETQRPPS